MKTSHTHRTAVLCIWMALVIGVTGCGDSDSAAPVPTAPEGEAQDAESGSEEEGGESTSAEDTETVETSPEADAAEDTSSAPDIILEEVGCPDGQKSCTDKNGLNDPFFVQTNPTPFVPKAAVFQSSSAPRTLIAPRMRVTRTSAAPTTVLIARAM